MKNQKLPLFFGVFVNQYVDQAGDAVGDLAFHCPACRRRHFHPIDLDATKPEFREAHCDHDSPFYPTGYLIQPWPAWAPESQGHFKMTARQQRQAGVLRNHAAIDRRPNRRSGLVRLTWEAIVDAQKVAS